MLDGQCRGAHLCLSAVKSNPTNSPLAPFCAQKHTKTQTLAALRLEKDALLDLLGEKDEELEALRSDLEDVKEAFRVQVDLLLERLVAGGGSQLAAVQQQ